MRNGAAPTQYFPRGFLACHAKRKNAKQSPIFPRSVLGWADSARMLRQILGFRGCCRPEAVFRNSFLNDRFIRLQSFAVLTMPAPMTINRVPEITFNKCRDCHSPQTIADKTTATNALTLVSGARIEMGILSTDTAYAIAPIAHGCRKENGDSNLRACAVSSAPFPIREEGWAARRQ